MPQQTSRAKVKELMAVYFANSEEIQASVTSKLPADWIRFIEHKIAERAVAQAESWLEPNYNESELNQITAKSQAQIELLWELLDTSPTQENK